MAAPVQHQQYVQQQPVKQQSAPMMQAQFVQQPQIVHSQSTREGCCSPHGKALSIKFRPAQLALGICMILNGIAGVIFGIIGIFNTRHVYYGYQFFHVYYNPTAWIGANIWGGMFVSFNMTTEQDMIMKYNC